MLQVGGFQGPPQTSPAENGEYPISIKEHKAGSSGQYPHVASKKRARAVFRSYRRSQEDEMNESNMGAWRIHDDNAGTCCRWLMVEAHLGRR